MTADTALAAVRRERAARGLSVGSFVIWSRPLTAVGRDPAHPAHDRLILNPHSAFYCEEGLMDMRIKGSENCRRALLGQPERNLVNWAV